MLTDVVQRHRLACVNDMTVDARRRAQ